MTAKVIPFGTVRIPGTDIHHAAGIKAGAWVFLNGIEAVDYGSGLHPEVAGNAALPYHGLPKHRREGDYICRRLGALLEEAGTSFANAVRLDQYYPTWKAVDPYHLARHAAFGNYIPPSTSVIMEELLVGGTDISSSLLAVVPGGSREPKRVSTTASSPVWSGYLPAVTSGDFIFIAGQLARGADNAVDPRAHVPPNSLWGGYEIRRQTEYMIREKFVPLLEAAGSSLKNAVKAQVYLRHVDDTPHFLDAWNAHFGSRQCALTIVPTRELGLVPGNIEVNLIALTEAAAAEKRVIDGCIPKEMTFGAAAVRANDLLFCSGLTAVDAGGPVTKAAQALRHLGAPARAQMDYIVDALKKVCAAGGTQLEDVTRIHQFHSDLADFYAMHRPWQEALNGAPVPFTAVRVPAPLPVPGCSVIVDPWFYAP